MKNLQNPTVITVKGKGKNPRVLVIEGSRKLPVISSEFKFLSLSLNRLGGVVVNVTSPLPEADIRTLAREVETLSGYLPEIRKWVQRLTKESGRGE